VAWFSEALPAEATAVLELTGGGGPNVVADTATTAPAGLLSAFYSLAVGVSSWVEERGGTRRNHGTSVVADTVSHANQSWTI